MVHSAGKLNFKRIQSSLVDPSWFPSLCCFYYFDLPAVVTTSAASLPGDKKEQEVLLKKSFLTAEVLQ